MRPLGRRRPDPAEEGRTHHRPASDLRYPARLPQCLGQARVLKFIRGTWHVRDLGSTNGTTVNGQRISSEHGVMPDDELGIAGHFFSLDYEPPARR